MAKIGTGNVKRATKSTEINVRAIDCDLHYDRDRVKLAVILDAARTGHVNTLMTDGQTALFLLDDARHGQD